MHSFIIAGSSKEAIEKRLVGLLSGYAIHAVDISRISSQSTVGIELVRLVKQRASLRPFKSETKAIVIEDAQTATIQAQNALLKTLEEPPPNTLLILLVRGNLESLLPTVISRCHIISLQSSSPLFTKEELEESYLLFTRLDEVNQAACVEIAEKIAANKEVALSFLEKMIYGGRQRMLDEIQNNGSKTKRLVGILHKLLATHHLLATTNVNPRFALENIFLSLV